MIYVVIMTGENLSPIYAANMGLIYWPVHSSSRRGRGKGGGSGYHYFSQLLASIYNVKNLVQYPSNNIYILIMYLNQLRFKSIAKEIA